MKIAVELGWAAHYTIGSAFALALVTARPLGRP